MKKCTSCDHLNGENQAFCSECGAALGEQPSRATNNGADDSKKNKTVRKKTPLLVALIAILMIGLFTGYQLLSKKYSEEAVIEQFKEALAKKDKTILKELIVPTDSRIKVNDQSLDALFALMDKEPSLIQDIENSLHNEGLGNDLFYLREDGNHYGIFNRYVVDTPGYFITLDDASKGTTVFLNDSEIGVLEETEDTQELGPFLAGSYKVKGTNKKGDKKIEDVVTVKLAGTKTKTAVALDLDTSEKEVTEKTVVKEVIRKVQASPTNDYYIIPDSDYYYLTEGDLYGLSSYELRLARNEIYARYGYIFKSEELQNYFNSQYWYSPNSSASENSLSSLEKANVNFIKSYE